MVLKFMNLRENALKALLAHWLSLVTMLANATEKEMTLKNTTEFENGSQQLDQQLTYLQ